MSDLKEHNGFYMIPIREWDSLVSKVDQVLSVLTKESKPVQGLNGWLTEKEAQELLGIKYGALYNRRIRGEITYSKEGGRTYYLKADVVKLIEKNKRSAFK